MDEDRFRTSIHEAAHAVIGRVLDLVCGAATVASNDLEGSAGFHEVADPALIELRWEQRLKFREWGAAYRARILCFMAGSEAERILLGDCLGGDDDDRIQIELMASTRWVFPTEESWLRAEPRMRRHAGALVRRHQAKIKAVADALARKGTLMPKEIDELIRVET